MTFIKNLLKDEKALALSLITALTCVSAVYIYYFLVIPQHWSLMDDYAYAQNWGSLKGVAWEKARALFEYLLESGRFRPLDLVTRVFRHYVLPVQPFYFHLYQFVTLSAALSVFYLVMRKLGLTLLQAVFGLFLVLISFSIKDWLVYSTAAESQATLFFFISVFLYLQGRKFLGVIFFACAFLSKESFFSLAGVYFVIELLSNDRPKSFSEALPFFILLFVDFAFVLFVRSLPRVYTQRISFSHLGPWNIAVAFVTPLLRNFAPAIALVALGFRKNLNLKKIPLPVWVGLSVVVPYTLLLVMWDPFNSWFYLHIPIPFGWALVLAGVWDSRTVSKNLGTELLYIGFISYGVLCSVNGSRNFNNYFEDARTVASIACEDSLRVPGLRLVSNCNEEAYELESYVMLEKGCSIPIHIEQWSQINSVSGLNAPFEFLYSNKCFPVDLNSLKADFKINLRQWALMKSFK